MRRILLLLNVIFSMALFLACDTCDNREKVNGMVKYEFGKYHEKNWDETVGTYNKDVIANEKTALDVAKAIFNGMDKSKQAQEYVPQSVFYDEQDEIWIVSFWKDSNEHILGGDCSIAIQKRDGKVLRIWFGE